MTEAEALQRIEHLVNEGDLGILYETKEELNISWTSYKKDSMGNTWASTIKAKGERDAHPLFDTFCLLYDKHRKRQSEQTIDEAMNAALLELKATCNLI